MLRLSKSNRLLEGALALEGSKSISNRALLMLTLAGARAEEWLSHISTAKDTRIMQALLAQPAASYDAGDAGTVFRFMTAYLCLQPGDQVLTGSTRMLERPIAPLTDALRALGADLEYLGREGYPPLHIGGARPRGGAVSVRADVSSQFLSALLMIGPYLTDGLELSLQGAPASRPYLDMTLRMMRYFGAEAQWMRPDMIRVYPGEYIPRKLAVEADWSAASYWYALAALSDRAELVLRGLHANSLQGDAVIAEMATAFGVETQYETGGVRLRYAGAPAPESLDLDFRDCPDIAQTMAVLCAGRGVPARLSGLATLAIKETDRIAALQCELHKIGVQMKPTGTDAYQLSGRADLSGYPVFSTYGDHRMAMAFAPLALLGPIGIEHPEVVEKSYPGFWARLRAVGFVCVDV
ncbi:MAG: 3-phosphoshikimate 1-carboxyvinyltransferase [Saprospiraceae bacterium]